MKTDREEHAFRAAYDQMVETTPPAPTWEELMDTATKPHETETERLLKYRRPIAIAATSALVVALVIGGLALFGPLGGTGDVEIIDEPAVTSTAPITETTVATAETAATTSVPTTATTVTAAPGPIPTLGEGWDIVFSGYPDDDSGLRPNDEVFITEFGYYLSFWPGDWYLMTGDVGELIPIESMPAGSPDGPSHFIVTGGPGVVAWVNVGPESRTEAQLWVSSDGINFERVASELLAGCGGFSDCRGTQVYATAASPSGRVVALAYDPLVWEPECECFDLNPVALVSDDGYEWTRQPLDLLTVLPAEWQGAATIRNPLVFVEGRWLTYATRYYNNGSTTDTAFLASENGIDWQPLDTGGLFEKTYLVGMAANDRGVVALASEAAYWSADGIEWTRVTLTDQKWPLKVAAYDDGYVAVGVPRTPDGAPIDTIWFSPDGTTWSRMALQLEEPTHWNTIVGDGPNLVAVGVTETNLRGLWRWSG